MSTRFAELYKSQIKDNLKKEFNYPNIHQIPKVEKIVLNMGVGEAVADSKVIDNAVRDLSLIAGQKAVATKAKKSIATYKLRDGMSIGCKVTLRGEKMYDFLERLVYIALPRMGDFTGFTKKSFDRKGNFNFGVKEHIIFPEIDYDKTDKIRGLNITIVTSASNDNEAKSLLEGFNLPFKK